jgi:hypothetical protein
MSPFWFSFFTHLRECGKKAHLFMITLAILFVLVVIAAVIYGNNLQGYALGAAAPVAIFLLTWGIIALIRARARRLQRVGTGPLSYDELRKARSKLIRTRKLPS